MYVVDSQFVFLSAPRDSVTGRGDDRSKFGDLPVADITWISVLKGDEAAHWRTCPGLPVILILTKSKQWRPPPRPSP